jgi:hypothetical protein
MGTYKVVVTGPFNVGKTEFVRTVSDIPIVSTERRITDELQTAKEQTTVAMDYGQVRVSGDLFHLYGTPGQPRFDFMWDILAKEMDAFVMLVDSSDRETFMHAKRLIRVFNRLGRKTRLPYIIAANRQDKEGALPVETVRKALRVDKDIPVVPCVAKENTSVRHVMEQLRELLV